MLGNAVKLLVVAGMKNYVYRFGNEIRIQNSGGPIGLGLTGEVADCIMIDWDRKLLEKLNSLGINPEIYARYKDDITVVTKRLEKGTCFRNGILLIDTEKKTLDENKKDEIVTMEVVNEIANTIDPMIQLTIDVPSTHPNNKLPILDLRVNVNKERKNRIDFEFYEKPTRNKKVILFD